MNEQGNLRIHPVSKKQGQRRRIKSGGNLSFFFTFGGRDDKQHMGRLSKLLSDQHMQSLSVFWIPGIPVHLLLGPFNGPASAQGWNDDRSPAEKTLMRRRLMRKTTAKRLRTRRPPHELFLVRGRTTSTSAQHVSMLSKKIRAEDCVPSMLPPTGRRPTFVVPA
jgi:hypothetical protein